MTAPAHLPDEAFLAELPQPTAGSPMPILVSGCLAGNACGYDGSTYGEHPWLGALLASPLTRAVSFCPEDLAFGTPRALCDIHGGDGFDVLDGKARVLTSEGEDWSEAIVSAALRMVAVADAEGARLALLMDISAACGSQVIYSGSRLTEEPVYRAGQGVAAAALIRAGLRVVSQRDFATLRLIHDWLGIEWTGKDAGDHHETEWYRGYFAATSN